MNDHQNRVLTAGIKVHANMNASEKCSGLKIQVKFIMGLAASILFWGITSISTAVEFSDSFNDTVYTNTNWLSSTSSAPQTWSFIELNGPNLGYHATVDNPSEKTPAFKIANSGKIFYNKNLYIEMLVRLDSHANAHSSSNKAIVGFSGSEENVYLANLHLNYTETPPIIDLSLSIPMDDQPDQILDSTPVSLSFDTFYKLVVQVDSNQDMNVFLFDLGDTLLGSVGSEKVLTSEKGIVVIGGKYSLTFDSFYLSGTPMPDINDNGKIDLGDAILILQILCNFPVSASASDADVNGDESVGVQEAMFILQKLGQVR